MLKYQVCLAVQHLDIQAVLIKDKELFWTVPLSILQREEQGTLYEMDAKGKLNWKLNIGWRIFYILFSFWWKLFWKRFEKNNTFCSAMSFEISLGPIWRLNIPIYLVIIQNAFRRTYRFEIPRKINTFFSLKKGKMKKQWLQTWRCFNIDMTLWRK